MRTIRRAFVGWRIWGALLIIAASAPVEAAGPSASIREYRKVIRTYPFSDPNPIATPGRIYPYYRYDGYTDGAVDKEWTVVELENAYVRVSVLPEIGGKVWSAVEKSTGRSFIYDNHVVKFRDIAMRGPWTSGGIEPNYGIIGHTPNCATPVDYVARMADDGSATIVIGVLDLLTRTSWRLEITLPADKAYFTTRSFWYNASPIEQPYYTWLNAGIKASGNLELVYPGSHYIGHGGEVSPWPVNPENGRNLAFYDQNDFGSSKSYHILGRHTDFFGAYWHDDDFGMGRYSTRDDKLGKKAWIWGLSRQGMIWEKLLTDTDGQYVEVQSGRLFNQAAEQSTFTPFKHRGFEPHTSDAWTEYWFPVKGTKGFVKANEYGALNVSAEGRAVTVRFSPLQRIDQTLEVLDGERVVHAERLALAPMQAWSQTLDVAVPKTRLRVRIGKVLEFAAGEDDQLSRPLESPAGFDWESVQGLHLKGKEWIRQREYARAEASLEACLAKDGNYVPALVDLAMLRHRALDDRRAWELARRALSIDTYDPAANYYYGLASAALGRAADAADGFEVAASAPGWRVAAWTELARLHLARGDDRAAAAYASRCLSIDGSNLDALQVLVVSARLEGRRDEQGQALRRLAAIDPLSPFAAFERYLLARDEKSRQAFVTGIRNELPHETYLELAAWYLGAARPDEARQVLDLAPANAEVLYWLAYLEDKARGTSETAAAPASSPARSVNPESGSAGAADSARLRKADAASPLLVFPFRAESAAVFEWAIRHSDAWTPRYFLALIHWSRGNLARARDLLAGCGEAPRFAPFYAARSKAFEVESPGRSLADLERAAALDPGEWRFGKLIAERLLQDGSYDRALAVADRYHRQTPSSYILGMLLAKCQLRAGRIAEAAATLSKTQVLPYEGATEGHVLHREAQLLLAARAWKAGRLPEALQRIAAAREWPEHLGAGKPYLEDVDERLEDVLEARCLEAAGRPAEARKLQDRAAAKSAKGAAAPGTAPYRGTTPDEKRILAEWDDAR